VAFESGSKLTQIPKRAFENCVSLISICIPAEVREILFFAFRECSAFDELTFEPGSKLTRIEFFAFGECFALRRLVVPSQVEILEVGMFHDCESLCEFGFEIPSRLKELDLPPSRFGSLCIPDSVAIVTGRIQHCEGQNRHLQFGRESRLRRICWNEDPEESSNGLSRTAEILFSFISQKNYCEDFVVKLN
jgi:hypothetical protein